MFRITWDKNGGDLTKESNGVLTFIFWRWMFLIQLPVFMFTESIVYDAESAEYLPYSEFKALKESRRNGNSHAS